MSQERNSMLERADKWIQRLDDNEYRVLPEASQREIPDVNGKKDRFGDLFSRAMTNYQSYRALYDELSERAAQGKLTADLPYEHIRKLSKRAQEELAVIMQSQKLSGVSDHVILQTLGERTSQKARDFLYYIDHAIADGVIVEGEATRRKLAESENEKNKIIAVRDQLQDQLAQVSTELISVRALYDDCEKKRHIHPAGGSSSRTE
jgi:hypothetical protein